MNKLLLTATKEQPENTKKAELYHELEDKESLVINGGVLKDNNFPPIVYTFRGSLTPIFDGGLTTDVVNLAFFFTEVPASSAATPAEPPCP